MAARMTHFKLGLLTIVVLAAAVAVVFGLGWRSVDSDVVAYHTYFDETVQGLEVGSPVKYRGVLVGSVADIRIAPDTKHVDVTLSLRASEVRRLDLTRLAPEVRAQLGTQGITGVKFVDIDYFDVTTNPPPELSFRPSENYIPGRASFMKGLEGNVENVSQRLPQLIEVTVSMLQRFDVMLVDLRREDIPARVAKTVEEIDGAARDLRHLIEHVDRARLPERTAKAIENLDGAIGKISALLDALGSDGGLVASTQRAADSVGDVGRTTTGAASELERTLRDLDEAAVALRELAESVDRDPDMLVKGRAKGKKP